MSKIRNKAKAILVEWLKTLLNEEEQKKVNIKNVLTLLPNQTHYLVEIHLNYNHGHING